MSELRVSISMSLDGYTAGPNQSPEEPLGVGGESLHDWVVSLAAFKRGHAGGDEGEVNESTPIVERRTENVGATIMGRNMFAGPGSWDPEWRGWWGEEPPFHHQTFVLTHHEREPLEMKGGTTFHFVNDGIESALEQAQDAAGGQDVMLAGGANVIQQYLAAGLVDDLTLSVVPIFLREGERLLDNVGEPGSRLEAVEVVDAPGVTHLRYRVA